MECEGEGGVIGYTVSRTNVEAVTFGLRGTGGMLDKRFA